MSGFCLNPNGVEFQLQCWLCIILWEVVALGDLVNKHNLPPGRHAANEYDGWVNTVIRYTVSHKPRKPQPQLRG